MIIGHDGLRTHPVGMAPHLYDNIYFLEKRYESMEMSSKNLGQPRLPPTLHHKERFAYEWLLTPRRGCLAGCPCGLSGPLGVPGRRGRRRHVRLGRVEPFREGRVCWISAVAVTCVRQRRHVRYDPYGRAHGVGYPSSSCPRDGSVSDVDVSIYNLL